MIDPNKVILDSEQSDAIIGAQAAEIRRLRLTDEEREAVGFFLEKHRKIQREGQTYCCLEASPHADAIQGLLERLA
jgi:hypothetical protein